MSRFSSPLYFDLFHTPWGLGLALASETGISFLAFSEKEADFEPYTASAQRLRQGSPQALWIRSLTTWFSHRQEPLSIPLDTKGTPFQEAVWQALNDIPYGETYSYSELAERIGKPTAVRAVANACGKNPLAVVVPCHRVVGKNGQL